MVKIIDYRQHENAAGETFFSLILQGEINLVESQKTGMYYATSQNASITSTFDENTCKGLVGKEIPGTVAKVACEPCEYAIPETGEIKTLQHRWIYLPEAVTEEQVVFEEKVEQPITQSTF